MSSPGRVLAVAVLGAALLPAARAAGEESDFGPRPVTTSILAPAFTPKTSGVSWDDDPDSYRSVTGAPGGLAAFKAALDLPDGARVDSIELDACDSDTIGYISLALARCTRDPGTSRMMCVPAGTTVSTGGTDTPGCGLFAMNDPIQAVDNATDSYLLYIVDDAFSPTTRFHGVRVTWRRQVAPGPATPTFGDVPSGHFAYRFVEALARAQVTGGCAPSQFCPDAPVTRAQMAVFVAVALGLGWQ